MYKIGVDIGSTYTKYCVSDEDTIVDLFSEKTPVIQKEHFNEIYNKLQQKYPGAKVISCGYGKANVPAEKNINELTALARGCNFIYPASELVLDIGGQDTKVILQNKGLLKEFFVNDKCAAGSGIFLTNVCNMLDEKFENINLTDAQEPKIRLSSVCAVFAQSEIVEIMSKYSPDRDIIIQSVVWQILIKAKALLDKVSEKKIIFLSGGLSQIKGIDRYAELAFDMPCASLPKGRYLSAIGAAISGI